MVSMGGKALIQIRLGDAWTVLMGRSFSNQTALGRDRRWAAEAGTHARAVLACKEAHRGPQRRNSGGMPWNHFAAQVSLRGTLRNLLFSFIC